jgi:hypothetical protein
VNIVHYHSRMIAVVDFFAFCTDTRADIYPIGVNATSLGMTLEATLLRLFNGSDRFT